MLRNLRHHKHDYRFDIIAISDTLELEAGTFTLDNYLVLWGKENVDEKFTSHVCRLQPRWLHKQRAGIG